MDTLPTFHCRIALCDWHWSRSVKHASKIDYTIRRVRHCVYLKKIVGVRQYPIFRLRIGSRSASDLCDLDSNKQRRMDREAKRILNFPTMLSREVEEKEFLTSDFMTQPNFFFKERRTFKK